MRRMFLSILIAAVVGCANSPAEQQGTVAAGTPVAEHADHGTASPSSQVSAASAAPTGPTVALEGGGSGYLAVPSSPNGGAVIVIQEWWGVDQWVREQADRFAKQGYVALAVDLYRGRSTNSPDEAHELMRGLPEDRAVADLKAGFNYLASRPDVDPKRIGAIGWCMGGGYALALASAEPRLAGSVINYGRLISDSETLKAIQPPILGNFGATDRGIPAEDVKRFDAALDAAGRKSDVKIYEGAGHAFMNPNNKQGYDATASADAWKRIDEFFTETIGKKNG